MTSNPVIPRESGITDAERELFVAVVDRRVGARGRGQAQSLVDAYLRAVERHAFVRTTDAGPVPTSLTVERSSMLIEISRQLRRVIEDYEIRALFRVTPAQAKSMRTTLLATYGDVTDGLMLEWSLMESSMLGEGRDGDVEGQKIKFADEDRLAAFKEQCQRAGVPIAVITGDTENPFLAVADSGYEDLLSASSSDPDGTTAPTSST